MSSTRSSARAAPSTASAGKYLPPSPGRRGAADQDQQRPTAQLISHPVSSETTLFHRRHYDPAAALAAEQPSHPRAHVFLFHSWYIVFWLTRWFAVKNYLSICLSSHRRDALGRLAALLDAGHLRPGARSWMIGWIPRAAGVVPVWGPIVRSLPMNQFEEFRPQKQLCGPPLGPYLG